MFLNPAAKTMAVRGCVPKTNFRSQERGLRIAIILDQSTTLLIQHKLPPLPRRTMVRTLVLDRTVKPWAGNLFAIDPSRRRR